MFTPHNLTLPDATQDVILASLLSTFKTMGFGEATMSFYNEIVWKAGDSF